MQVENPSPRDKRVLKAHRKRYIEDKDLSTIAEEMGYGYDTIRDYFRDEATERIKQLYDEEEIEFLRIQLLNMAQESTRNAQSYISKAVGHEEANASDYNRAAKEEQEIPMRYIKMLQELGVIDKPKERKEVRETSEEADDLMKRMQQAYRELEEEPEEVEES